MTQLNDLSGHTLRWEQPGALRDEYELHAGELTLARLRFPSWMKNLATAVTAEGTWYFDRPKFWQRRVIVLDESGQNELAAYQPHTWKNGGVLTLADGRVLTATGNFWMTQFSFVNEYEQPLVEYTRIGGVFHASCDVLVQGSLRYADVLDWLVPFGWYLIVLQHKDSAAAAAA